MSVVLPSAYQWLLNEKGPSMLVNALKYYGVSEVVGQGDNPEIMKWADETNQSGVYKNDDTPWCGLFMAKVAKDSLLPYPKIAVRASEWGGWCVPVKIPKLGDILVFTRKGGGHVGLYVGEDRDCFHVLGGNQGNKVSIVRIDRMRLTCARRAPWRVGEFDGLRRVIFSLVSGKVSSNEE